MNGLPVHPLRIVVVGPCASGKSTLVKGLRATGFDAYVCAQEHSEIPNLWRHLDPQAVVFLDVDLESLRKRRARDWPETIYLEQTRRLQSARSAAHVVINTALFDVPGTLQEVIRKIKSIPPQNLLPKRNAEQP